MKKATNGTMGQRIYKNLGLDGSPVDVIHNKMESQIDQELYIGLFGSPGKMIRSIAENFNLSENRISQLEKKNEKDLQNYKLIIINQASKELGKTFIVNYGSKEVVKRAGGAVPILGASVGFAVTFHLGLKTIDDYMELSKKLMEQKE